MKVIEVRVDLTRVNTKQYESDKVGLTATLEEGDNAVAVIADLKKAILGEVASLQGSSVVKEEVAAVQKSAVAKPKAEKKPEVKTAEPVVSEVKAPATETAPAEVVEAAPVTEPKTAAAKETKAKVAVKVKATPYDRKLDTHKKLLAEFLGKAFPTWKESKNLVKAGEASTALVGADFLDGEGEVLESFKESFLAYLR